MKREEEYLVVICLLAILGCLVYGLQYTGSDLGKAISKGLRKWEEQLNEPRRLD